MTAAKLRRPFIAATALLASLLVACGKPGNYRDDDTHRQLLQTLRACLVQVSIHNRQRDGFQSPCANQEVSSLNGIKRSRLTDVLGRPTFCRGVKDVGFPKVDDCPSDQNPEWSFYQLPQSSSAGGGPELVCESDSGGGHCLRMVWKQSH